MYRRIAVLALMAAAGVFAQEVHLKTRNVRVAPVAPEGVNGRHQIVVFDHAPGVEDLDALLQGGAQVVSALPDNAVVVSAPGVSIRSIPGVSWTSRLDIDDKISPDLAGGGPLLAIVEFHSDVSPDEQETVAEQEGIALQRPAVLTANHAIVAGSLSDLRALAANDEVAYVFPADPDLLTDATFSPCAGMLTTSGAVAQFANIIHGWDLGPDGAAHLGYAFGSLTTKVPAATVQSEIVRALNEWAKHTNVIFSSAASTTAARTILVKFASGAHGDAYPFDGPGGMLAHTFYPVPFNAESVAGDMHLDADEKWHAGSDVDIYSVALHEAGHALGLGHSDKPGDVMYPYYRSGMALSARDIGAVQSLYGSLEGGSSDPIAQPTPNPNPTASALRLTLDSAPASVTTPETALTGTVSGGTGPYSVQWQTDHGYSGRAAFHSGANSWTSGPITLVTGSNEISVSAFDSATAAVTQTATVGFNPPQPPPGAPHAPIAISITSPSSNVSTINASAISIGGSASGGTGITKVTWQTAAGAAGVATGTGHWLASAVPLLKGTNTIVLRAYDASGNSAWGALVVVRNF